MKTRNTAMAAAVAGALMVPPMCAAAADDEFRIGVPAAPGGLSIALFQPQHDPREIPPEYKDPADVPITALPGGGGLVLVMFEVLRDAQLYGLPHDPREIPEEYR